MQSANEIVLCNSILQNLTDYFWLFTDIHIDESASYKCAQSVIYQTGDQADDPSGLRIRGHGGYIRVKNFTSDGQLTCWSTPASCATGVTIGLRIIIHDVEEGAVLFGSGAESGIMQGFALVYRSVCVSVHSFVYSTQRRM